MNCPNCDEEFEPEFMASPVTCPRCDAKIYLDWDWDISDDGGESYYYLIEKVEE